MRLSIAIKLHSYLLVKLHATYTHAGSNIGQIFTHNKKENVHFFFFVPGDSHREPEEKSTNEKKSKMITFSRKVHHE
jgi:hypothetical protein